MVENRAAAHKTKNTALCKGMPARRARCRKQYATLHLVEQKKMPRKPAFLRKNMRKSIDKTYIHRV